MNIYVDGAAFINLTEADVKLICKKIGPTKEICHLISQVTNYIYHVSLSDIYLFFIDKEKHQSITTDYSTFRHQHNNNITIYSLTNELGGRQHHTVILVHQRLCFLHHPLTLMKVVLFSLLFLQLQKHFVFRTNGVLRLWSVSTHYLKTSHENFCLPLCVMKLSGIWYLRCIHFGHNLTGIIAIRDLGKERLLIISTTQGVRSVNYPIYHLVPLKLREKGLKYRMF